MQRKQDMSEDAATESGRRRPSRDERAINSKVLTWGVILVIVTGLVSWFGFAAAYGVGVGNPPSSSSSSSGNTNSGGGGPDYVYLAVNANPDRNQSTDQFTPGNFTVPAHTLLVFTITNYDNGQNVVPAQETKVNGTVHNLIYVNGSTTGISSVTTPIAHTFTILTTGFNVPLPSAGPVSPSVVTFEAYFNDTGTYTWQCMAQCDPWSMGQAGYMTGTLTVA